MSYSDDSAACKHFAQACTLLKLCNHHCCPIKSLLYAPCSLSDLSAACHMMRHLSQTPVGVKRKNRAYLSCRGFPSRSASDSINSWAAGKSAASENPREGRLMKSFTFRGACCLLPLLLMAHELSLTAGAAEYTQNSLSGSCVRRVTLCFRHVLPRIIATSC